MLVAAVLGFFFVTVFDVTLFADEYVYDFGKFDRLDRDNLVTLKEQIAKGVPYNQILCYCEYHYLLYRVSDGSPVCVKQYTTAPKLVERGWATLGNSSLSITTDKTEYHIGEPITIIMKNDGDTLLHFNCSPKFTLYDDNYNVVNPYGVVETFLCTAFYPFDTLATTTLIWNQYNSYGNQTELGMYAVTAEYFYPFVKENEIHYNMIRQNTTFTILP